jgi:hypothetical protein
VSFEAPKLSVDVPEKASTSPFGEVFGKARAVPDTERSYEDILREEIEKAKKASS